MSILNSTVSYYPSRSDTESGVRVNLITLLRSRRNEQRILELRSASEEQQKELKATLPGFTPAGVFHPRTNAGLISLSGIACMDLDDLKEYNIDLLDLLKELRKQKFIAYAGASCRANGVYCLVRIMDPLKYTRHYDALVASFKQIGLENAVDPCHRALNQIRYVSYNTPELEWYNHYAEPFHLLASERKYYFHGSQNHIKVGNKFSWAVRQAEKKYPFIPMYRHKFLLRCAWFCYMKGMSEQETVDGLMEYENEDKGADEIVSIVKWQFSVKQNIPKWI